MKRRFYSGDDSGAGISHKIKKKTERFKSKKGSGLGAVIKYNRRGKKHPEEQLDLSSFIKESDSSVA